MMVLQGRKEESPKTRGPNKNIPSQFWKLTKGAFVSFLKLYQASGATQSTMKKLSLRKKQVSKQGRVQTDRSKLCAEASKRNFRA